MTFRIEALIRIRNLHAPFRDTWSAVPIYTTGCNKYGNNKINETGKNFL